MTDDLTHLEDQFDPPRQIWRVLGIGAFLAAAVFWIYVFANGSSVPHNDEFDDPAWAASAEAICAETQAAILALPSATTAENPAQRGEFVALGTAELERMINDLESLGVPASDKGAETVPQWLADYEIYLQDRRNWTEILRTGDDPPFVLSAGAGGGRVTDLLGVYAEVNDMASCAPSEDT